MATEVLMPRQGQSVESCIIIEWKVTEGDTVTEGQPVCDIETDKAAFEVEAPVSGTVLGIFYPADADVEVLKVIAAIGEPGEDISALRPLDEVSGPDAVPLATEGETAAAVAQTAAPVSQAQSAATGASPRAKNLAAEKDIDISGIAGSGPHGRVIERDVMTAQPVSPAARAKAAAEGLAVPGLGSGIGGRVLSSDLTAGTPEAFATAMNFSGNSSEIPVKGIRKLIAERMHASLQSTAQLTHNTSADARSVLDYRRKCKAAPEDAGITINDIVLYATIKTLAEFPELNAHWLGDRIIRFENVNLGLAVDTERGLVVPVIRHANLMSLAQLSFEAKRLATACINGDVDPDALRGGTFTVTNLGALGIESFTPVLNAPEVGILGVCAIQPKPVMSDDEVDFVPHMGLSLTFDHCAVDGAPAARFLAGLRARLAAFELTLEG